MDILDVFNQDAFSTVSLTTGINLIPHKPAMLGQLVNWEPEPIHTTTASFEYEHGQLKLLQTAARGSQGNNQKSNKRTLKKVEVPHVPHHSELLADDIVGVRAFGQASMLETWSQKVAQRLQQHQANHDVTMEFHRAGALAGRVLDADGSELLDLFSHFGVTEEVVTFDWTSTTAGDLQLKCKDVTDSIEDKLGGILHTGIVGVCDDLWFRAMYKNADFRNSWDRWNSGQFYRDGATPRDRLFTWGGISWLNYRGKIGNRSLLDGDGAASGFCRFFPVGVQGLFKEVMAPADYIETANTLGKRFYAKQHRMKYDKGVEFESQTNVLYVCTRPSLLIKGQI